MGVNATQQAELVSQATIKKDTGVGRIALFKADGTPLLLIDKSVVTPLAAVSVANATASVAAPTKAEFDAVVALANDIKAKYNLLLTALKS